MTCSARLLELVECARRGLPPGRALRTHLQECAPCDRRWRAELQLSVHLQSIRARTGAMRSPDTRREDLLPHLARLSRRSRGRRIRSWVWAFSAAAALLIALVLGRQMGSRIIRSYTPESRIAAARQARQIVSEPSGDAGAFSSDEFIAVPFTPPLAPGETVRLIHADLYPGALASMGINVDPAWPSNFPADVVVGGDGFPRAVRIAETNGF